MVEEGQHLRVVPADLGLDRGHVEPAQVDAQLAQQEPKRSITQIADNLYRFQNNFHFSVFLVTDDGVIATDPINAEAAAWLEKEIRNRFNQEIKYLVLSHDHRDHSAGGEVWADTATVIAHANAREVIIGEKRPTALPDITFTDHSRYFLCEAPQRNSFFV